MGKGRMTEKATNKDNNFSNFSLSEGKPLILNSLTNTSRSMQSSTLLHIRFITLLHTMEETQEL